MDTLAFAVEIVAALLTASGIAYGVLALWGARDFDKLLAEAILQFDPKDPLHLELVNAATTAEKIAAGVALPDDIHFIRARKLIRDALKDAGITRENIKTTSSTSLKLWKRGRPQNPTSPRGSERWRSCRQWNGACKPARCAGWNRC